MRGVVSFSIYGDNPMYSLGAIKQAHLFQEYSKAGPVEWDCRFYIGPSVDPIVIRSLMLLGATVIPVDRPEDQTATFWRFDAFKMPYDVYLVRDTDSRLCSREIAAINEWISTEYPYHVMRDHPFHGVPVLAGLWGATHEVAPQVAELLPTVPPSDFYESINLRVNHAHYESNDFYQVDQWWLRLNIYPLMKKNVCAHDEWFRMERKPWKRKFPTPRRRGEFVGKGWTENDEERFPEHSNLVDIVRKTIR